MSRRLLLVDDSSSVAAIVGILARRGGHQLTWASRAEQATALLSDADLVLLDVNLPGQSGPDWLASLEKRPPVALFIQSSLEDDLRRGWEAGADYLLAKELLIDPTAFLERLSEILTHADGQRGHPSLTSSAPIADGVSSWIRPFP
jgi:DNA-binding response OmpR family regulator